ncbi:hypothetical protein V1509DRAFT_635704 [Lipomyces kononenkoae]
MVGVAGGSKACSTCRQRKVKCDLQIPICGQCVKSRRQCSGPNLNKRRTVRRRRRGSPVDGYDSGLDMDVAPKASQSHNTIDHKFVLVSANADQLNIGDTDEMTAIVHGKTADLNATRADTLPYVLSPTPSSISSSLSSTLFSTPADLTDDERPTTDDIFGADSDLIFNAPPLANAYFEVFLSNFMDQFCLMASTRFDGAFFDPWITSMPGFVASTSAALTYAARAVVVAHFSRVRPNRDLQLFSLQLYTRALRHQSHEVSRSIKLPSVNDDMIATSILLGLYETFNFTTRDAYVGLIKGCLELFALRGPHAFKTGLSAVLFQSTRTILTVDVLAGNGSIPSFLAEPEWITIPFETVSEKPPHQTFYDILLCVSQYRCVISAYKQKLAQRRELSDEQRRTAATVYFGLVELQSKLNEWLIDYKKFISGIDCDNLPDSVLYTEDYSTKCDPNATNEEWSSSHIFKPSLAFANNSVATLIPLYYTALAITDKAKCVVYDCAQEFPGGRDDLVTMPIEEFEKLTARRITGYCRLVCQSVEYVVGIHRTVAALSILYPLKVAQLFLQDPLEKYRAITWCQQLDKGFGLGISMIRIADGGCDNGCMVNSLPTCPHCGEKIRAGSEESSPEFLPGFCLFGS